MEANLLITTPQYFPPNATICGAERLAQAAFGSIRSQSHLEKTPNLQASGIPSS